MHNLNPEDYILQFEAQGSNLLFQDLVIEYPYVPMDSLVMFGDNQVQSYILKNVLPALDKEGESHTVEKTEEMKKSLSDRVKGAIGEIPNFNSKQEFTHEDFAHMVETLQTIAKEYFYFDTIYWNSVFEKRLSNKTFEKNIKLVEDFKNAIRIDLAKIYFDKESYIQTLVKRMSEKFSVPIKELEWYLVKDLENLFKDIKIPSEEIISRMDHHVLHWRPEEGGTLYIDDKAKTIISSFRDSVDLKTDVLRGKVAHSKKIGNGVTKGKVKVFIRNEFEQDKMVNDLSKMEEGQILVAQTTSPELIDLMKKASVIITDLGGMLSHAAITARELNIPCIVDTKYATKLLKDGDMVEVDLEKGTVRKI